MNVVEKLLSILNNSQLPENVPVKVSIDGTEYAYIHNTSNDKVEKVLLNTLIQSQGSGEWVTFTGTRVGGDLLLTLGDYDNSNNGNTIKIDDDKEEITINSSDNINLIGKVRIKSNNGEFGQIIFAGATPQTFSLPPNKSGTIALTSDLINYASDWSEATGSRENADLVLKLGDFDDSGNGNKIIIDDESDEITLYSNGGVMVNNSTFIANNGFSFKTGASFKAFLFTSDLTANRNYEMQDQSGTIPVYSTGTFTPTLIDTGSGATYTYSSFGDYVKNGKTVTINIRASITSTTGAPTGSLRFTGLPFSGKGVNVKYALSLSELSGTALSGVNLANVKVYLDDTDVTFVNLDGTSLTAPTITNGDILITGTYIIE